NTSPLPSNGPPHWPRSVTDRGPVVLPPPDEEPYDLAELVHDLLACEVENDVSMPVWRLWSETFHLAAHMAVDKDMIYGRQLSAPSPQTSMFNKAQIPICSHAVLDTTVRGKKPYYGPCDEETGSHWLSQQLGVKPSDPIWVLPIRDASNRVCSMILGHHCRLEPPQVEWMHAVWTAAHSAMNMVAHRRDLRRVHSAGRPAMRRPETTLP
ncbi:MAG: hypothetical protein AAFV29_09720, partial [Myxococcota bacterium]